jgi:beta-lactamase regulating signal transducer with metallopeptidase domain
MIPSLWLHFAGVFVSYFLQVGVAYAACVLLSRLVRKPQLRFLLWMAFLLGSATYWLGLIWSEARGIPLAPLESAGPSTAGAPAWRHPILVPPNWSHGVLTAGLVLALGYICVVVLLLGLAAWRHVQLRLVLRRGVEPSEALAELFRAACSDFRLSHSRLLVMPGLRSPATACLWRPRILLPEICEDLGPTPQLEGVLYHELVHVSRRDYLWAGMSDLIGRLLFFHPAVWQARKRLRLEGELACDMAVVEARPAQRADYADSLAYFVRLRMLEEGISLGVDFAASASTLGLRIRTILAPPEPMPWWKRTSQAVAALVLVTTTALLLPALNVLLDFAPANVVESASQTQALPAAPRAHHRPRKAATLDAQKLAPSEDSLTKLRARSTIGETPAYTLVASAYNRPDAEPDDMDRPGWKASGPPVRTVTSVVFATIRQIPINRIPRPRDRDHDGDRE